MTTATLVKPTPLETLVYSNQTILEKYPLGKKIVYSFKGTKISNTINNEFDILSNQDKVIKKGNTTTYIEYYGGSAYTNIIRTIIKFKDEYIVKYNFTAC